jgi:hypothetical protein
LLVPLLGLPLVMSVDAASTASSLMVNVVASADDARSDDAGKFSSAEASSLVGAGNQRPNVNGYRFANLAIPPGAIIESVKFSLVKQGDQWQHFRVNLAFEASDSAAAFTIASQPLGRPLTSAQAAVNDNVRRTGETRYPLGSATTLAMALQQVVDRPGWRSGNSVALIAHGPATTTWSRLGFYTFDGGANRAPRLEIAYRLPSPPSSPSPTPSATPIPSASAEPSPSQPSPSASPPPSSSPSPSMPGGAIGACGEDMAHWHSPLVGSCAAGHEHGDAPPAWVQGSRWHPMFDHPGNTPSENQLKHTGFKGFALRDDGVEIYIIIHLDSNPNGHASRFHSVQVWARDATGAVSHWDLWADFGQDNNTGPNLRGVNGCEDTSIRPIMAVRYSQCGNGGNEFESWYSRAGAPSWGWDFGFNLKPQFYSGTTPQSPSNPDLAAMGTWLPTGQLNNVRRVEAAWYADRPHPTGTFYSTQWGELVSGPGDPRCGQMRTIGAKTYPTLCIEQYIAPSMTTVSFPGNSVQRDYPTPGVTLPN